MLPGKRSEPCKVCSKPVYILERLNVSGRLLHRTCFKCARCHHQLSIANYYETESGAYCCEMCPDEEVIQTEVAEANKKAVKVHTESSEDEECSLPECQQEANNNAEPVDQENNTVQPPVEDVEQISDITVEAVEDFKNGENNESQEEEKEEVAEVNNIEDEQIPECDQEIPTTIQPESVESLIDDKDEVVVQDHEETERSQSSSPDQNSPKEILNDEEEVISENQEENQGENSDEIVTEMADKLEINETDTVQDNQIEEAVPEPVQDQVSYPEDLNPFGDEEFEEKIKESTNPFGSESDEEENDNEVVEVVSASTPTLSHAPPKPPRLSLNPFGSDFEDDEEEVKVPRRKKRHAPQPPGPSSSSSTPVPAPRASLRPPRPPPPKGKSQKDQDNLNRRSQILEATEPPAITLTPLSPDKSSMEGKWKKKKGPAPPRPIPPKRQVKKLPRKSVNTELLDIEVKQQELERQGVELEKTIRELCEKSDKERAEAGLENNDRDSLGLEAEDLIVQLFELVNEKNELFRRQTELMYMKREHRLEEEHADIEHQVTFNLPPFLQ